MHLASRTWLVVHGLVALSLLTVPARSFAQQDAGAKIRGDVYWPHKAAARRIESARGLAQDFQTYVAKAPKPEPSVVKDIKTELGRYLEDANKHLAAMKKDFAQDKEIVTAVEGLEKGLAAAIEHNKAMIECCENEKFEKIAAMSCCADLVKELDRIHADHVALMKKLSAKYAAKPTK
jgi:hypothetical protein